MVMTADRITLRRANYRATYPAGVDVLYNGGMACLNTSGYVVAAANTAGNRLAGVVDGQVDNSAGAAGDKNVVLHTDGEFLFKIAAATQADVGKMVWVSDDQTVTLTQGAPGVYAGEIRSIESATEVWVDITPAVRQVEGNYRVLRGSLTAVTGTTGGGCLSLANPFAETAIVLDLVLHLTVASTGGATVDAGIAANGTTSSDTLIDALTVNGVTGALNYAADTQSNGLPPRTWASTEYITITASATLAGLVGTYWVLCLVPTPK